MNERLIMLFLSAIVVIALAMPPMILGWLAGVRGATRLIRSPL